MKYGLFGLLLLFLAGCAAASATPTAKPPTQPAVSPQPEPTTTPNRADLKDYGPAPELTNTIWLNSDQPLRLADLRGKVVLLDMWTFG